MSAGCPPGMIPTVVADITAADFTKPAESLSFYPSADIAIPKLTGGAWRLSSFRRIPWSPDTPRPANQNSKRQPAETVRPFLSFGDVPDQENLFYGLRHRHGSWNQNQTGTFAAGDELSEVLRHRRDTPSYYRRTVSERRDFTQSGRVESDGLQFQPGWKP